MSDWTKRDVLFVVVGVCLLVAIAIVGNAFFGCDSPPQQPRTTPVALFIPVAPEWLGVTKTWVYPTPDAYFVPSNDSTSNVYTMPLEWHAIPFIVEDSTSYRLRWTAAGDSLSQIISLYDSDINGLLWYVVKGFRIGDQFELEEQ